LPAPFAVVPVIATRLGLSGTSQRIATGRLSAGEGTLVGLCDGRLFSPFAAHAVAIGIQAKGVGRTY